MLQLVREWQKRVMDLERKVGRRAAWRLGMPDRPVFPATLANYDCRRFDRPQTLKARSKSIAINLNFNLNKCTVQKRETKLLSYDIKKTLISTI